MGLVQYFADSSAAVKYYHREIGSDRVAEVFESSSRAYRISDLGVIEIQSALALRVRSGLVNQTAASQQLYRFLQDIFSNSIEVYSLTYHHYANAAQLIGRHSYARRLRTLDAIQLAVALDLAERNLLDVFLVSDRALADVAVLEGLSVINPEIS
jgi:predicted nucleic acid-binding protein